MNGRHPRIARVFTMSEVADMLEIDRAKYKRQDVRTKFVRRLFRRLERRDGETYIQKQGRNYVAPLAAVERLRPHAPTALSAIRDDVDEVGEEVKTLKKRVNDHGSRITKLEEFRRITHDYLTKASRLL